MSYKQGVAANNAFGLQQIVDTHESVNITRAFANHSLADTFTPMRVHATTTSHEPQKQLTTRNLLTSTTQSRTTCDSQERKCEEAFLMRHKCQGEPALAAWFEGLKESGEPNYTNSIERAYSEPGCGLRFEIRGQHLDWHQNPTRVAWWKNHQGRGQKFAKMIRDLLSEVVLPDMKFAIQPGDGGDHVGLGIGSGVMFTESTWKDLMVIPRGLVDWGSPAQATALKPRCRREKRKHVAVFRGSPTGGGPGRWDGELGLVNGDGKVLPRSSVVKLSLRRPDLLDARFTSASQWMRFEKQLHAHGMIGQRLSYEEQSCYAAIVVPYGNSVADRLVAQMATGIPIVSLRSRSDADEFYFYELKNGTHWLEATPETLEGVLEALLKDQSAMDRIGQNGRTFVKERLGADRLRCFMYKLLTQYAEHYNQIGRAHV